MCIQDFIYSKNKEIDEFINRLVFFREKELQQKFETFFINEITQLLNVVDIEKLQIMYQKPNLRTDMQKQISLKQFKHEKINQFSDEIQEYLCEVYNSHAVDLEFYYRYELHPQKILLINNYINKKILLINNFLKNVINDDFLNIMKRKKIN
ncbi:MAG: hypothetical protein ACLTFB_00900 [Candidatus Phytoplasma pyri]